MILAGYYSFNPKYSLELCNEYFQLRKNADYHVTSASLHLIKSDMLFELNSYDESYDEFIKYINLFSKYSNNQIDCYDLIAHPVYGISKTEFERYILKKIEQFIIIDRLQYVKNIIRLINKFDFDKQTLELIDELTLYLKLKSNENINCLIDKLTTSEIVWMFKMLSEKFSDFAKVVLEYDLLNHHIYNIKSLNVFSEMYHYAVLVSHNIDEGKKLVLYNRFINTVWDYIVNLYNPELLNDDDIVVFPEHHRFVYLVLKARRLMENGDLLAYIKELREILKDCSSMRIIIQYFCEEIKKQL